jgi:deoxyribodipyrimidine photo-lyase
MDGRLVVRRGQPSAVLGALAAEVGAATVFATADFAPYGRRRDAAVAEALGASGRTLRLVGSPYAVDPGTVTSAAGTPFRVFTPFRRAWEATGWPPARPVPAGLSWGHAPSDAEPADLEAGAGLAVPGTWADLPLAPAADLPEPGEPAAAARLAAFVADGVDGYAERRNLPGEEGTSRLSPYLRFGCLHPRQMLAALGPATGKGPGTFRSELAWREFYADVLFHLPHSARRTLQPALAQLAVDTGPAAEARFARWATGTTGYPLVDAAMRQLLAEGWVHNRARMVAASFLVKDLHLPWRWGARWFMYHLVDGDLASNQHGWQWTAGTGTDAAPFHRIFNPATQAERFDPDGAYVRRFVPEAAGEPGAGPSLFDAVGAPAYPAPMVDHRVERAEALARFAEAREASRRPDGPA